MDEKTTTFVNILMFGTVSAGPETKSFCNSQLIARLRQVLDREAVVHERAGNKDGDSLDRRRLTPTSPFGHKRNGAKVER